MAEPGQKRENFLFLPEARHYHGDGEEIIGGAYPPGQAPPEDRPQPEPISGEYPCPCCGYLTLPVPKEDAIAFICPVCFWENDVFDPGEDTHSDENGGMTLPEGRANFKQYGAVRPDLVRYARPPLPEERPHRKE